MLVIMFPSPGPIFLTKLDACLASQMQETYVSKAKNEQFLKLTIVSAFIHGVIMRNILIENHCKTIFLSLELKLVTKLDSMPNKSPRSSQSKGLGEDSGECRLCIKMRDKSTNNSAIVILRST